MKMYAHRILSSLLPAMALLLAAATSCTTSEPSGPGDEVKMNEKVVLFYLGGDNNLWREVDEKIDALTTGWTPREGNRLLIFADARNTPAKLMEIKHDAGQNRCEPIHTWPEANSADKEVLAEVIRNIRTNYPARSYGLVVFSHATGWLPPGAYSDPAGFNILVEDWFEVPVIVEMGTKSLITDGDREMEIRDFAAVLPDGMFDFIVFEACHMAGVEVAYELKSKADYILASAAEILSPGFTPAYPQTINKLFDGDLKGFGQDIFDQFDSQTGYRRSATFSLIRTSGLDRLAEWVKSNCRDIGADELVGIQYFDRTDHHLFFDMGQICSIASERNDCAELRGLIEGCVAWKAATPSFLKDYNGFDIVDYSGLTAYIMQDEFPSLNDEYRKLKWFGDIIPPDYY